MGSSDGYKLNTVEHNRLILKNVPKEFGGKVNSKASELKTEELSMIEENISGNLDTHWAWMENTLNMIDSYSPLLFKNKNSQSIDGVNILIGVNTKGRVSGFEVLGEVNKRTKERKH
jgi:hypothetical protein